VSHQKPGPEREVFSLSDTPWQHLVPPAANRSGPIRVHHRESYFVRSLRISSTLLWHHGQTTSAQCTALAKEVLMEIRVSDGGPESFFRPCAVLGEGVGASDTSLDKCRMPTTLRESRPVCGPYCLAEAAQSFRPSNASDFPSRMREGMHPI
jgi:hypothetical protein